MKSIADLIATPGRQWHREKGASEVDVATLRSAVPFEPPEEYLELLKFSNGGEGELALPPLCFQLFDTQYAISLWRNEHYQREFPHFFFFGSNGGLESIAFDMTESPPWPVVMVDCIAGAESARQIAPNMAVFIQAIGLSAGDHGA